MSNVVQIKATESAGLPANLNIDRAKLPDANVAAKAALAKCYAVDERSHRHGIEPLP